MLSWRRQWTPDAYWLPRRVSFHRYLGLEAVEVTEDRGDGEHTPIALEPQDTVLRGNITLNREFIPFIGMPEVVDRDVVVLDPSSHLFERRRTCMPSVARGSVGATQKGGAT